MAGKPLQTFKKTAAPTTAPSSSPSATPSPLDSSHTFLGIPTPSTIRTSNNSFSHHLLQRPPPVYASLPDRPRTVPMSIPNARESPPPPLPPPRYINEIVEGGDPGWHFANRDRRDSSVSASVRPGSSLLGGGSLKSARGYTGPERNIDFGTRDENLKSLLEFSREEERSESLRPQPPQIPDLAALLEYNKLKSENHMGQKNLEKSSQAYDKHLLSRIGGPHTPPPRSSASLLSTSLNSNEDASPSSPTTAAAIQTESGSNNSSTLKRLNGQLRPLSMPERRHSDMGASTSGRWASGGSSSSGGAGGAGGAGGGRAPPSSAASPGFSGLRSPLSDHGAEPRVLPLSRTSTFASPEDASSSLSARLAFHHHQHHHPHHVHQPLQFDHASSVYNDPDFPIGEAAAMSDLAIHDRSPSISEDMPRASRVGQKRRAQSPPSDSNIDPRLPTTGPSVESWQKRSMHEPPSRDSPQAARISANQASLSSTASSALKNGSYDSFGTSTASTAPTSYSDRPSPNAFQTPENSVSSPRSAGPPSIPQQQQAVAAAAAAAAVAGAAPPPPPLQLQAGQPLHRRTTSSGVLRASGLFICGCCPKKPRKFDTEEDLRNHEMEKQYICQYCQNRFKNKNEAERHQNSLHLRRHSWSCAALGSFEAAFHPTPSSAVTPTMPQPPNPPYPRHNTESDTCGYCGKEFPNPPNWDARVEHLNRDHKFGECNQSKKFFRADHFRQHLKHSHAGSAGKWTNMLENACMKEEPALPPSGGPQLALPMHGIIVGPQGTYAAMPALQGSPQAPMASMMAESHAYHLQQQQQTPPAQLKHEHPSQQGPPPGYEAHPAHVTSSPPPPRLPPAQQQQLDSPQPQSQQPQPQHHQHHQDGQDSAARANTLSPIHEQKSVATAQHDKADNVAR